MTRQTMEADREPPVQTASGPRREFAIVTHPNCADNPRKIDAPPTNRPMDVVVEATCFPPR